MKYYYNLKFQFLIWIYIYNKLQYNIIKYNTLNIIYIYIYKMQFIHVMSKLNFQHSFLLQASVSHDYSEIWYGNMLIWGWRNISYYYQCWKQLCSLIFCRISFLLLNAFLLNKLHKKVKSKGKKNEELSILLTSQSFKQKINIIFFVSTKAQLRVFQSLEGKTL